MTNKIEITTSGYNWRRWGKPWIAHVNFATDGKATYDWGTWIGDEACAGVLVINANEKDIIARGQKDHRGGGTFIKFYQVRDGKPVELESKVAAYKAAQIDAEPHDTDSGLGVGGINNDQSLPVIPTINALERIQKMQDTDIVCKRCGASKNFDGAMFTTLSGSGICDDCV